MRVVDFLNSDPLQWKRRRFAGWREGGEGGVSFLTMLRDVWNTLKN